MEKTTHQINIKSAKNENELRKENLKNLYDYSGCKTQKEFAEKIGIRPSHLSAYLTGNSDISPRTAKEIEDKLVLPDGWLSNERIRFYVLANVHLPESSAPNPDTVTDLARVNKDLEKVYKYRPLVCARWTLGAYDLIITVEVINTHDLHEITAKINGALGIGRTSSLLVLRKNAFRPTDFFSDESELLV